MANLPLPSKPSSQQAQHDSDTSLKSSEEQARSIQRNLEKESVKQVLIAVNL